MCVETWKLPKPIWKAKKKFLCRFGPFWSGFYFHCMKDFLLGQKIGVKIQRYVLGKGKRSAEIVGAERFAGWRATTSREIWTTMKQLRSNQKRFRIAEEQMWRTASNTRTFCNGDSLHEVLFRTNVMSWKTRSRKWMQMPRLRRSRPRLCWAQRWNRKKMWEISVSCSNRSWVSFFLKMMKMKKALGTAGQRIATLHSNCHLFVTSSLPFAFPLTYQPLQREIRSWKKKRK